MKRILWIIPALIFAASPTIAATTWEAIGPKSKSAKATCTSGTEAAPASTAYSSGTTYAAGDHVVYAGQPYASLQAANTNHTPSSSPTWWSLVGLDLSSVQSFTITVCALGAGTPTISDGSVFDAYWFSPAAGKWAKTDWSITMPTGTACVTSRGDSPGWGLPNLFGWGRLLFYPNGAAASDAGSMSVVLEAVSVGGSAL